MKTIDKNKILVVIVILILVLIGVNYIISKGKNNNPISTAKFNNQETKKDTFAIMLQQADGTYKETTSTSFNQPGYVFNGYRSGCIDANGTKIDSSLTYDSSTNTITFMTHSAVFCYVYFDIEPYDIEVTIKTDGVSGKLPTAGGYKNILECSEGAGTFNNKYQRLEITNVKAKCTLNYEEDTATHTSLVNKIISLAGTTQGKGKLVHEEFTTNNSTFTANGAIEQANYMNLNNDTTYPWTWSDTDKSWTSSNRVSNSTSTITFNPNSDGYYQICYIQSSEKDYDYGKVYKNNTEILSFRGKTDTSYVCENLGNLSTSDTIKVTYQKDDSGSTGKDAISFYLQTGTYNENPETIDAGYRYEGQNPNNYIWFNNEMWRIIGAIPTKIDSSGTTTNLVKIIRNDVLGGIVYDAKSKSSEETGAWGSNTLYTLLNNYYYGKKDGTDTAYCYGSYTTAKTKCDYRVNGISSDSTDYYGRMVKNVYWNTGASDRTATASAVYKAEKIKQAVQGRIGLMNASDYGYATSATYHNINVYNYNTSAITLSNWLYSQSSDLTSTQYSVENDRVLNILTFGNINKGYVDSGDDFRPVAYLNEHVYVISGSGTEADPYIIGM